MSKYIDEVMREFDEEFVDERNREFVSVLCVPKIKSFIRVVLEIQEKRLGLDEENIKWCLMHLNKAKIIVEKLPEERVVFDNKVSIHLNVLKRIVDFLTKSLNFQEGE